jgi:hypothetical protein
MLFLYRIKRMSAWTSNDIEQLTRYYTKGFPIKEISKILRRTPTALHKAISRLKLHALRPPKEDLYFSENGKKKNIFFILKNFLVLALMKNGLLLKQLKSF